MGDAKMNTQDEEEKFHHALEDFPFYDCEDICSDLVDLNGGGSISVANPKAVPEDETVPLASLRRRQLLSHCKSSEGDSMELSRLDSSVSVEDFVNAGEGKIRRSCNIKEYEKKLESYRENNEENGESSTLTDLNNNIENCSVRDELNLRENNEEHTSILFILAGIIVKAIIFPIDLLVKFFMFPFRLIYYLYMLVFDPFGILKHVRQYLIQKSWRFVFKNVLPFVSEWLKEHKAIWKLGLKCGWRLVWSSYVCAVLVGILVSAFLLGGLLIRGVVEEPMRMKRSLNFDYRENSPVAFIPIMTQPEPRHDIYLGEKREIEKASGSRAISPYHKLQVTVSLTLPESDYNQNLGIFQVRVDFLATDGKILTSSRRPCMLQYKSQPIRLLKTFLKVAPILTGYTSETQSLNIHFRGFTEGDVPTASLRVVIEQRAQFHPGGGIPEIYAAYMTLESELPLLKRAIWFWKKTLFVWVSLIIFTMELVFALICCKPIFFPTTRLREATNRGASQNDRPGQS